MGKESKSTWLKTKDEVYEQFNIPEEERRDWNIHHIIHKSEGGGNDPANLVPLPRDVHEEYHKKCQEWENRYSKKK